jgi:hypothetical protein
VPPADGFEAFFSTRVCAAAESSRSPTSAVADAGDGALVAALAFLRQDIRAENQRRRDWRALFWRQQLEVNRQPRAAIRSWLAAGFPPESGSVLSAGLSPPPSSILRVRDVVKWLGPDPARCFDCPVDPAPAEQ